MTEAQTTEPTAWTIGRLLGWTRQYLAERGVEEARLATEVLLAHALDCAKIELYTRFEQVPEPEQTAAFRELVRAAGEHTPVAYLVGHKEFFSLRFEVTPAVLIPRPETELLVMRVMALCEEEGGAEPHLLEVGTGSGCIAVALLKQVPAARMVATDISAEALAVARRNAETHAVPDRLELCQADRLALPPERVPEGGFDALISNPPYVSVTEVEQLPKTIRGYEPHIALTEESDGLSFYRTFAEEGPELLRVGGSVLVEAGGGQAERVCDIFHRAGRFEHVGTWRDAGDPHERVMQFRYVEQSA